MQSISDFPHSWLAVIVGIVFGGGAIAWLNAWLSRKKPEAERQQILSAIRKLDADTRKIEIEAGAEAGDAIVKMINALRASETRIDQLRDEVDEKDAEIKKLNAKLAESIRVYELENGQLRDRLKEIDRVSRDE